jgi:predicted DNA-binding protein with PD1-like motif
MKGIGVQWLRHTVIAMKKAKGKISNIVVMRLQRGEEILPSVKQACQEYGVKNGVILSMIGSLDGAKFFDPVMNPNTKSGISYADPIFLERPVQFLSAHGEICHDEAGEIFVHIHATFADSQGNAYGGHLAEEGNKVMNTINTFVGVVEDVEMGFEWEDILGVMSFVPKQAGGEASRSL